MDTKNFIDALFEPTDLIEIRTLLDGRQHYLLAGGIGTYTIPQTTDVFFGANPRTREAGTADAVALARCAFVDIDNATIDDALHRLKNVDLPQPTAIVDSGHGAHLYWRLDEPITDMRQWSTIQRQLAELLDADPKVCDAPRIMRLPGSVNCKSDPVPCTLIECDPRRSYPLDDITDALPDESPTQSNLSDSTDIPAATADATIPQGRRNGTLTRYAGYMRRCGFSEGAILAALRTMNGELCRPPLDDDEVRRIAASISKYMPDANVMDQLAGHPGIDISGIVDGTDAGKPGFRLLTLDQMSSKPPAWLVRDVLPENSLAVLFGRYGCGKSFVAIGLACHIATGTAYRGQGVKQGPVVYIAGEGHAGLRQRVEAWQKHHGVSVGDDLRFSSQAAAVTDDVAAIVNAIDALDKPPRLIVIDTLARNIGVADENNTQDMSAFVNACDLLRQRYDAAVLVVHHTGWSANERARGSVALSAAADVEFKVSLTKDPYAKRVTMICTKAKDSNEPADVELILQPIEIDGVFDEGGQAVTSCVCIKDVDASALCGDEPVVAAKVPLSDGEAQMMRHLRPWQDTDGQTVAGSAWATQKTMIELAADQGVKRPTAYSRINGLLEKRHAAKLTVGQKGKRGTALIMNPLAFVHVLNDLFKRPEEIRNAMATVMGILKNGPLTESDVITAASDRHKNPAVVQAAIQRLLGSGKVVSHDGGKLSVK